MKRNTLTLSKDYERQNAGLFVIAEKAADKEGGHEADNTDGNNKYMDTGCILRKDNAHFICRINWSLLTIKYETKHNQYDTSKEGTYVDISF
ncbi:hypothetical protein [Spirosoma sp.]|uniref:hypothetical protein n=1 Tax=Spirosoma sp. TaxID=1899569 RepID=UPI003B3B9571